MEYKYWGKNETNESISVDFCGSGICSAGRLLGEFEGKHGGGSRAARCGGLYLYFPIRKAISKYNVILKIIMVFLGEGNRWYNRSCKKLDEAVYLGGIDNETDISGQID